MGEQPVQLPLELLVLQPQEPLAQLQLVPLAQQLQEPLEPQQQEPLAQPPAVLLVPQLLVQSAQQQQGPLARQPLVLPVQQPLVQQQQVPLARQQPERQVQELQLRLQLLLPLQPQQPLPKFVCGQLLQKRNFQRWNPVSQKTY